MMKTDSSNTANTATSNSSAPGNNNNNNNSKSNNIISTSMAFDMYPTISGGKQDPVREVVMKYIDYFLPDKVLWYSNNV